MFSHGAVTSIVGPNGCGKSTMVKLVDGLLRPQAGEVRVGGVPTLSLKAKARARRVAVLAQASRPPAMTVEALVACGRYPYQAHQGKLSREDREHVERALELAGIARFRTQELRRLSGGERQRAFIAMTLAQDTDLIVLDEPTTYLDIRACHETMELIRRLNEEAGKTIVMVIHRSRTWRCATQTAFAGHGTRARRGGRHGGRGARNRRHRAGLRREHPSARGRRGTGLHAVPGVGFCDAAPQAWHREPSGKRWARIAPYGRKRGALVADSSYAESATRPYVPAQYRTIREASTAFAMAIVLRPIERDATGSGRKPP